LRRGCCGNGSILLINYYRKEEIEMENIVTDRLIIRKFRPDDWQDLYEYLSDKEVVRFEPYDVFTKEQARDEASKRSGNDAFYAVCLKDNDKLIGNLYLGKGDFDTWELGYVFNRTYQGQGFAAESSRALLDFAFVNLGARRVVAMCNPENSHSWKLLERLHMRREALLLKNIYFKRDEVGERIWLDTYEYAILKDEWCGQVE
jgi:RimJ/RimL family protein N-acetyltransferase